MGSRADEEGSALVAVLVMAVVLATLTGAVLTLFVLRHRFVARDLHRAQAVYAAEAGVHAALARLYAEADWRPHDEPIEVPGLSEVPLSTGTTPPHVAVLPLVTARALGGYLQMCATAERGASGATVCAQAGQRPPAAFDAAVVLGDTLSSLTLVGETRIVGNVITGRQGVETAFLNGRPFKGRVEGEVERAEGHPMPPYDDRLFQETLARFDRYAALLPPDLPLNPSVWSGAEHTELGEERAFLDALTFVHVGPGGALTPADSALLRASVFVVGAGDLRVEGPLRLPPGSTVLARGTLRVQGAVAGEAVVLSAERVEVEGPAQLSGQALGRRGLRVGGGATFSYPSLLYLGGGDVEAPDDRLVLGDATVEGLVLVPRGSALAAGDRTDPVRLEVTELALVRGAVFSERRTELRGRVEGTVAAQQFYFYASPASYVNWLAGPEVVRPARPGPLVVPVYLGAHTAFEVVAWRERSGTRTGGSEQGSSEQGEAPQAEVPSVRTATTRP